MSIWELGSLQLTLFAMMLVGALLKKRGILDENGKRCLTDLCVNVVIPCNIFKSCLIQLSGDVLRACGLLLVSAVILQAVCLLLNRVIFNRYPDQRKKVLQYCTIVPMSGFLGNPVAEGIYDQLGVLYTSIFLIPMRVVMWSVGTTYFIAGAHMERKKVLKNVLTHPCLVAVYLGLICMVTQVQLPGVVTSTVQYIGSCNSALTMFIAGCILADVPLKTVVNRDTVAFSVLRLALLPLAALGLGVAGAGADGPGGERADDGYARGRHRRHLRRQIRQRRPLRHPLRGVYHVAVYGHSADMGEYRGLR